MSRNKLWRPPLKSSMSMPNDVGEISFRRKSLSRKVSIQSSLSVQNEAEEKNTAEEVNEESNPRVANTSGDVEDNVKSAWRRLRTHTKSVPFKDTEFFKAIRENNIQQIEAFVDSESFTIDEEDENNLTPFLYACQIGHMESLLCLIKLGCDVSSTNSKRWSALHSATRYGQVKIVSFLLQQGVILDIRDKSMKRTAVHEAAILADDEILKILIAKMTDDPSEAKRILKMTDKDGRTPLHFAAYNSLTESIGLLLSAGADVQATDDEGLTPMHSNILSHRGKVNE